jgi:NAD+ diphosphatase
LNLQLKFCPKCGKDSLRYSGKRFSCLNCDLTYFHNVASAVAGVLYYKDSVLFTIRKFEPAKGKLDLPGGFVDYNESAEDALSRELWEELNIEKIIPEYLFSYPNTYFYENIKYQVLDIFFTAQLDSIDEIIPADDVADWKLIKLKDLNLDYLGFPSTKAALKKLIV